MKSILKEKTKIEQIENIVVYLSIFFVITSFFFSYYLTQEAIESGRYNNTLSYVLGYFFNFMLPFVFQICGLSFFCDFITHLRSTIPSDRYSIEEDGKQYEVLYYKIPNIKKYYYQGKLHRELHPAIVYNDDLNDYSNAWYLEGNYLSTYRFNLELPKYRTKNKVNNF